MLSEMELIKINVKRRLRGKPTLSMFQAEQGLKAATNMYDDGDDNFIESLLVNMIIEDLSTPPPDTNYDPTPCDVNPDNGPDSSCPGVSDTGNSGGDSSPPDTSSDNSFGTDTFGTDTFSDSGSFSSDFSSD